MRRQSTSQIVGREGERWFESRLPPQWSIQRPIDDFGLDGIVAVGDNTHLTPYEFGVQVKSSSCFRTVKDHIVVPNIGRDELEYWSRKFFPTLLVAYDVKKKAGYFEWVSSLISASEIQSGKKSFYLHIRMSRVVCEECWATVKEELTNFHREFSIALQGAREIIPLAARLAGLLRNLCASRMADLGTRDGLVLYSMAQAWTHEEVIRQLDKFIPIVNPNSMAAHNLKGFRDAYMDRCMRVFHDFENQYKHKSAKWIWMKKLPEAESTLNELSAMLSDCVSGLLGYIDRMD